MVDHKDEKSDGLTVITTHVNADFDALASMLAATMLYPEAVAAFPGSQEKGLKEFFVQSAMYLMNLKRPKDVDLEQVERLVLVDTRQRGRIGRFAKLLKDGRPIEVHVYDHHPDSEDDIPGDLEMIEETGACTSIMTRLLVERGVEITEDQATLLALGIYEDTGSFTFKSTTPGDLSSAGLLVERGANLNTVASLIVRQLDASQVGLLDDLLHNIERLRISGVEVAVASCSTDSYSPDFAVVAHKLVEMENLAVLFALARMEDRIHVVARSRLDEVDVGRIATALGGGGHPFAASATVKKKTLIEVRQTLTGLLESQINPGRNAREIMSFPVLSVSSQAPLSAARETLTRYSVNVLLVMDNEELLGIISRQVVEKGIFLGVEEEPVGEYMNSEVVTIPPEATLAEIQDMIVGQRQRILPVVEKDRVVGVVTRSDLLNILMDEPPIPDPLDDSRQARNFVRKKSVINLMRERLPQEIIDLLKQLGNLGQEMGYNVYAVGGLVRDLVLRRSNLDVDLVVEGDGIAFAQEYGRRFGARVRDHVKFGTAVMILKDGFKIDVATARLEYYESPAALPIIETSSLKLDLYRRDFTINTLAVRLNPTHYGTLIDYFGAQRDIKEKAIRVLHSLSLVEDPTRCLRAVRFEQRFGFRIGKLTMTLIRNAVKINAFAKANPSRMLVELVHILEEPKPALILERLDKLGLYSAIHPALRWTEQVEHRIFQVTTVLSWFDLLYLETKLTRWIVYLLALLNGLRDKQVRQVLDRLGVHDRFREVIRESRIWSGRIISSLQRRPGMRPASIKKLLDSAPLEGRLWAMARGDEDLTRQACSAYFTDYIKVRPMLNGNHLIDMGFKPGPLFKEILELVRDARLNGWVRTLEDEKFFVERRFGDERDN